MKQATLEEKSIIIQDAFQISPGVSFAGKRVTIIDDIYQSGNTLNELATLLNRSGADVYGLVATKTFKLSNQDIKL